jgi:photosystem II stability/assembly factor-like uncharacterized protein
MATKRRSVKRAQPKSRAASALTDLTRRQLLAGTAAALPKAAAGAQLTAKRPSVKRKQPLESLVDRPDQRHYELIQDRRFGSEGKNLAQLRLNALREKTAAVARRSGTTVSPLSLGANNWVQLGPTVIPNGQGSSTSGARVNVTGRITAIVVDPMSPSTIYLAAAGGGVWKTVDGGVTWFAKSDNEMSLAIGALAMAPSDHNRLYAGTGEGSTFYLVQNLPFDVTNVDYHGVGVLRSSDGGDTWAHVGSADLTGAAFYRIAVHPTDPDVLFGATSFGLMRSQDGGATWTAITSGLPPLSTTVISCTDVTYDPTNANRAWCAFWGSGIYRTDDANAAVPTWTKLTTGLPAAGISRIALALAPSNHDAIFALIADSPVTTPPKNVSVYGSIDGGNTWSTVTTSTATTPPINIQGSYTLNIAVDVSTPDVLYVCARELYRCVQSGGAWTVTNVGTRIHVDNHAFASHPTNNLQIYAGTDGGIYKSADGGSTWDDSINKGPVITQFEFIDQHPSSDALVIGGTQDNGTEMFRNSLVFYHSADFDGGQAGIDPANPNNVIHTFSFTGIERSIAAGKFGTYSDITNGLSKPVLFYPPWTYDDTNSNNLAFGTNKLRLSAAQGNDSWPTSITLPGIGSGRVSAIHYVNSSLIYCGTTGGLVYKAVNSGSTWTATQVSASPPLPTLWIWDIFLVPGMTDVLVLAMAGYGNAHVWKGTLSGGSWTWADASGTPTNRLPDAPANALEIDPTAPNTMYVGTDVGVWTTTDGGANWFPFSDGLPNVDVYDLKLHEPTRLLRAATHGRGLWERQLGGAGAADVRLVIRDHVMDTGRLTPSPSGLASAWEDPYRQVNLGDPLFWWNCADVKVDSPAGGSYQMPVASVDYVAFETALEHRNPQRGALNRVYVQVQNRGVLPASNVVVKILYADATPGLPDLPSDFWTAFPGNSAMSSPWTSIGAAQTIASLRPEHPAVLEWDWTPPMSAAAHSCLLVVASSTEDSPGVKSLVLDSLVTQNRQVGLKNLHIADVLPFASWDTIRFYPRAATDIFRFGALPKGWLLSLVLPKEVPPSEITYTGLEAKPVSAAEQKRINKLLGKQAALYDLEKALVATASREGCTITGVLVGKQGIPVLVAFAAGARPSTGSVQLIQESRDQRVLGGNTFVLRGAKATRGSSS